MKNKIIIINKDQTMVGYRTGGSYPCRVKGCKGTRIAVRWDDKKITFPCTQGMKWINYNVAHLI